MKGREGNGSTGERIKAAARKGEREIIAGVKKTSREYEIVRKNGTGTSYKGNSEPSKEYLKRSRMVDAAARQGQRAERHEPEEIE